MCESTYAHPIPDDLWSLLVAASKKTGKSYFKYKGKFYLVESRLYQPGFMWDVREIAIEELSDEPQ